MNIKNIIFTAGLLDGDDYSMENLKQWRGDILIEDQDRNYFELTFITIDRLCSELKDKTYSAETWGWVVVNLLTIETIIESTISLANTGYFSTQKPRENIEPESSWTVISIE